MKIVITGATSGVGEMVARRFAGTNNDLIVTGRQQDKLAALVRELSNDELRVIATPLDLSDCAAVEQFAAAHASGASVIISSAADFGPTKPMTEVTADEMLSVFRTNVVAPLILAKHAFPDMLKSGFGRIVDVSSTSGLSGYALRTPYCTTKHAVVGLTRTLNQEIRDSKNATDVRAFCVCPGPIKGSRIETQIRARMKVKGETDYRKAERSFRLRLGRFLEPEEVVNRIMSLLRSPAQTDEIVTFK
ncbi:MAG: SDR family oxidoreductase [bacterium]